MVKRWTASENTRIVIESLTTSISICRDMQKIQPLAKYFLPLERQIPRIRQNGIHK